MKGKLNPTSQSQEKRIYQRAEDATGGLAGRQREHLLSSLGYYICLSSNAKSTAIHLFLITMMQAVNLTSRLEYHLLPSAYLS